jgi:hypothetical protein
MSKETTAELPKIEAWDPAVIRESALEVLGDSKGAVKKLVAAMVAKFATEKDVATCDKCGGASSAKLTRCPFCGDADVEVEAAASAVKRAKSEKRAAVVAGKAVTMTAGDYKKKFAALAGHKSAWCKDVWAMGVICKEFRESRGWMLVKDDDERPKYKSFDAWLVDEAGFSKSYIYGVMNLVESFSEEQVKALGTTHMIALTSVDPVDRPALVAELEKREYTAAEFNALVATTRAARKTTKLKPTSEPVNRVTVEQTPVASPKAVTAIFPLERVEVELFARLQAGEAQKPATDLAEQPWGRMELENGVTIFFGLARRAEGQFVLTVQAARDDG